MSQTRSVGFHAVNVCCVFIFCVVYSVTKTADLNRNRPGSHARRMRLCSGNVVQAIAARNVIDAHARDLLANGEMIHTLKSFALCTRSLPLHAARNACCVQSVCSGRKFCRSQ